MLRTISVLIFYCYCFKLGVRGTISFVDSLEYHWHARHVMNRVELNMSRCTSIHVVHQKIRHEIKHLVQLRDNKQWLLWFERIQPWYFEHGLGHLFYSFSLPEIEAHLFEPGMNPPNVFDGLSPLELVEAHERGALFRVLVPHVREYLHRNGLESYQDSLGVNVHFPWE